METTLHIFLMRALAIIRDAKRQSEINRALNTQKKENHATRGFLEFSK